MGFSSVLCLSLVFLAGFASSASLPPGLKACKAADPKFDECLYEVMGKLFSQLPNGLPELGVEPFDPITIKEILLESPNFKIWVRNAEIKEYLKNAKIDKVSMDVENMKMELEITSPLFESNGDFEIDGKILMLPVKGTGTFVNKYIDNKIKFIITGKPKMKDGKKYMDVQDAKVEMEPALIDAQVSDLFKGKEEISEKFKELIRDNWRDLFDEIKESFWKNLSVLFRSRIKAWFDNVPYEAMFN